MAEPLRNIVKNTFKDKLAAGQVASSLPRERGGAHERSRVALRPVINTRACVRIKCVIIFLY